ncbi:MAG: hypothetical protein ACRDAJ_06870 [Serratia fonticola]
MTYRTFATELRGETVHVTARYYSDGCIDIAECDYYPDAPRDTDFLTTREREAIIDLAARIREEPRHE